MVVCFRLVSPLDIPTTTTSQKGAWWSWPILWILAMAKTKCWCSKKEDRKGVHFTKCQTYCVKPKWFKRCWDYRENSGVKFLINISCDTRHPIILHKVKTISPDTQWFLCQVWRFFLMIFMVRPDTQWILYQFKIFTPDTQCFKCQVWSLYHFVLLSLTPNGFGIGWKLHGVGPVDNRPFTD